MSLREGGTGVTKWQTRRELVTKNLTMWKLFRIVDGVEEAGK